MLEKDWATAILREAPYWREGMLPEEYNIEREYFFNHLDDYIKGNYTPLWKQNIKIEEKTPPDRVFCPLVDDYIESYDCIENSDVAGGIIKEDTMPEKYKVKKNWRDICKQCKYYNY